MDLDSSPAREFVADGRSRDGSLKELDLSGLIRLAEPDRLPKEETGSLFTTSLNEGDELIPRVSARSETGLNPAVADGNIAEDMAYILSKELRYRQENG